MTALPRFSTALLLCTLVAAPLVAGSPGTAKGTLTINKKNVELKHAVAVTTPSSFDKKKTQTRLLISNVEIPAATLADTFAMMKVKNLSGVEVSIEEDGQIVSGVIYDPSLTKMGGSFSIVGPHQLERDDDTPGMFAGKLYMKEPDDFFDYTFTYSATFATPLADGKAAVAAAEKKPGKALPSDGGDPGNAYRAYLSAMKAGDAKKVKSLVSAERAKQMEAPEFPEMFAMIREMMPEGIKVTGGSIDGNRAWLTLTAKQPGDGSRTSGTCDMVVENGAWKIQKESWKTSND